MFNNKERKEERKNMKVEKELSAQAYNLCLGGCIAYGLIMNTLSVFFFKDFFLSINMVAFLIAYLLLGIAGVTVSAISKNPIVSFIGYNMLVLPIGGALTISLVGVSGADVLSAFAATSVVVVIMLLLAIIAPTFFEGLGRTLLLALTLGLIAEIVALCMGYGGNLFNWFFVLLFSTYIGYDFHVAQQYPKTLDNAVDSALDIYLDIINLFIRILDIISKTDN